MTRKRPSQHKWDFLSDGITRYLLDKSYENPDWPKGFVKKEAKQDA